MSHRAQPCRLGSSSVRTGAHLPATGVSDLRAGRWESPMGKHQSSHGGGSEVMWLPIPGPTRFDSPSARAGMRTNSRFYVRTDIARAGMKGALTSSGRHRRTPAECLSGGCAAAPGCTTVEAPRRSSLMAVRIRRIPIADFVTFRLYSASHTAYYRGHTICFRFAN